MKKMLCSVLLALTVQSNAQSSIPEFFSSADKQLHMGGCYVISSMTTALVYKRTANKRKSVLIGLGTGIALGVAKELYDIRCGNPELGDIAADAIGAGLGVLCVRITF